MDERIRRLERNAHEGVLELARLIAVRLRTRERDPLVRGFVAGITSEGALWIAEEGELGFLGTEAFVQLLIEAGLGWEEAYGFSYDDRMQDSILRACEERVREAEAQAAPAEVGSGLGWVGAPADSELVDALARWRAPPEPPRVMGWEALLERRFR